MSLLDQLTSTIQQREDNYDNPLPNFLRIAILWSVWYEQVFTPLDVIFMMDLMKTAREIHNHSDDTLLDKTGYTISCYERIDNAMHQLGYKTGIEYWREIVKTSDGYPELTVCAMYRVLREWKELEANTNCKTRK